MTDENYQGVGDNGVGGSWGTGDSLTATIMTEIEKRIDDELKKFKAGIQGDGVVSGLAVSQKGAGANQSVDVASGSCTIGGTKYTEAGTVNVALDAAHGTYARWDIITYDASAGNPSKVTGTAVAIPTIPDVPSGDIILALVLRAANDNVVSDAEITDKRIINNIYIVPSGGIISWSGAISAIPSGWVICDGNNSTPNLTDRFVIHADADAAGTRNVGDTGGAMTHALTTAELASHAHNSYTSASPGSYARSYATCVTASGACPSASVGSGNAHSILNKYHALAFIMKT